MGTSSSSILLTISFKDHPHAYGDKNQKVKTKGDIKGSSPRVWGQVTVTGVATDTVRIIPTRMGTRKRRTVGNGKVKDHPHAYGDKLIFYRYQA